MTNLFDDEDKGNPELPQLSDDKKYVFIDTYQGVISIDVEICLNIAKGNVSESKAGTCGYCGERNQIKSFEKPGKNFIFIHLCDSCFSSLKTDLENLVEENSSDLVSDNV